MFSRILNPRIYFFFLIFFLNKVKNVSVTIYFHKQSHFAPTAKRKQEKFREKIVDSEFVKACHEQVMIHPSY